MPTVQGLREKFLNYRSTALSPRRLREPVFIKELGGFFAELPRSLPPHQEPSFADYYALSLILHQNQGEESLSSRDAKFLADMRQAVFGEQPLRVISVLQLFKAQCADPTLLWPAIKNRDVGDMVTLSEIIFHLPKDMLTEVTITSLAYWRSNLTVLKKILLELIQAGALTDKTLTIIDNPQRDVQGAANLILAFHAKSQLYIPVLKVIKQVTLYASSLQKKYVAQLNQMLDWLVNNSATRDQLLSIMAEDKCSFFSVVKVLALFRFTQEFIFLIPAIKTLSQISNRLRDAHLQDLLAALYFLKKHDCLTAAKVELLAKHPYESARLALACVFLTENQLFTPSYIALLAIGGGRFANQWAQIIVALKDLGYLEPMLMQHLAAMQNHAVVLPKLLKIMNAKNLAALAPIATRAVIALEVEWAIYLLAANTSLEVLKHPGIIALMACLNPAGLLTPANVDLFLKLYECEPGKCQLMMHLAQEGALHPVDFNAIVKGVLSKEEVEQRLDEIESINYRGFSLSSAS